MTGGEIDHVPIPGLKQWTTPDGIVVLQVHYSADPDKAAPEWKEREMKGLSPQQWEREYEINFNAPEGKAFFPEFDMTRHVASGEMEPFVGKPVIRGWDFGLSPATLFAQWGPTGQLCIFHEIQSWDCGIRAHGAVVKADSLSLFPGGRFVDYADPAGMQRAQTDEKTCFQLLRLEYGFVLFPGPVSAVARSEGIRKLLTTTTPNGTPMMLVDPRCAWLIAALAGGYHRREIGGRYTEDPVKDDYSHIIDCLGYIAAGQGRSDIHDEPIKYPDADVF